MADIQWSVDFVVQIVNRHLRSSNFITEASGVYGAVGACETRVAALNFK